MNAERRRWLVRAAALALTVAPGFGARAAEAFPLRPVTMLVPWTAGGAT